MIETANGPADPPAQGPDPAGADTVLILRPYPVRAGKRGPGAATGR
jgi:hypothetical protein